MALRTLAVALMVLLPTAVEAAPKPIRVLILSGRNNHNWKQTTPRLKEILEKDAKFAVDVTVPPEGLTSENLSKYGAIVSNWNSWGRGAKEAEAWGEPARKAYLDFVRQGKGHVTVHAGGSSYYDGWPEYRKVTLIYWAKGKTGHGPQHEFKVRVDKPDHPAMRGVKPFETRDELWNRPGVAEGTAVLASSFSDKAGKGTGQWEPAVLAASYGEGRCFAILLGHDAKTMEHASFQALLVNGTAWAATGK
jgi:type 1 glutamine amidotransferase